MIIEEINTKQALKETSEKLKSVLDFDFPQGYKIEGEDIKKYAKVRFFKFLSEYELIASFHQEENLFCLHFIEEEEYEKLKPLFKKSKVKFRITIDG